MTQINFKRDRSRMSSFVICEIQEVIELQNQITY